VRNKISSSPLKKKNLSKGEITNPTQIDQRIGLKLSASISRKKKGNGK